MTPVQRQMLTACYTRSAQLNDWEKGFVMDLHWKTDDFQLSEKRVQIIERIATRLGVFIEDQEKPVATREVGSGAAGEEVQGDQGAGISTAQAEIPQGPEATLNKQSGSRGRAI